MTTYKEIFGKQIKQVSSDLTDAESEGQIWFNTIEGVFKTIVSAGAWSSGASLNTAGGGSGFGATINASARVLGPTLVTEEYNGSSWTTVNPASSAQGGFFGGSTSGTQTAAYIVGGRRASPEVDFGTTSTYDGTNWTAAPGSISPGRIGASAHGTQTAGIAAAGAQSGVAGVLASTATFNGTAWTGAPSLGVARGQTDSIHGGTQTATITVSGERSPSADAYNLHEQYDGSSWTAETVMTSGGAFVSGSGGQDSYVAYAGSSSPAPSGDGDGAVTNRTIAWDGTAWTTQGSMAIANRYRASLATITSNSSALAAGGATPSTITSTEEYALSVFSPIAATWASGGNTNIQHSATSLGAGTVTAALVAGGSTPADRTTEEYNGSSWTSGNLMNTPRSYGNGGGLQTAAIVVAGNIPASPPTTDGSAVENYDGTNWTAGTALSTPRYGHGSAGVQTSIVVFAGGQNPPLINATEEWDGSSWTGGGNYPISAQQVSGTGTQTAGLGIGGATYTPSSTVAEYNGSSWTAGGSYPSGVNEVGANGTQTSAIAFGGSAPSSLNSSFIYDGSAWSADANLATAGSTKGLNGTAPQTAGLSVPSSATTTEEYVAASQVLDYKTLTSS